MSNFRFMRRGYKFHKNVFGKARGSMPYCHTAAIDNAAQKDYHGLYIRGKKYGSKVMESR
jgi:hypothetical protein